MVKDNHRKTRFIEYDIELEDPTPIKQHPYRVNPIYLEVQRKELDYMLENGIIERSLSPWSSPCVLVPKTDKTVRFCTNFRRVNAVTKTDSYPIPRISDLIDRVGDACQKLTYGQVIGRYL